ncbi:MAG: hypothetical protein WBC59_07405 [Phycisphaerae bacterium]
MLTLKGMKHVRTGRNVKGFRSCPQAMGVSPAPRVAARLTREEKRLVAREARRLWIEDQWTRHFEAAVPPLARSRRTKGK